MVLPLGIEPRSPASETDALSIVLQERLASDATPGNVGAQCAQVLACPAVYRGRSTSRSIAGDPSYRAQRRALVSQSAQARETNQRFRVSLTHAVMRVVSQNIGGIPHDFRRNRLRLRVSHHSIASVRVSGTKRSSS